jgi:hypothetical protein
MGRRGRRVGNVVVRAARRAVPRPGPTPWQGPCAARDPFRAEVLHAWHEWTATVPEQTASMGRTVQFPDLAGSVTPQERRLR